jgi:hypothetical protein
VLRGDVRLDRQGIGDWARHPADDDLAFTDPDARQIDQGFRWDFQRPGRSLDVEGNGPVNARCDAQWMAVN